MTSLSRPCVEFISTILQTVLNLGPVGASPDFGCLPRQRNGTSG